MQIYAVIDVQVSEINNLKNTSPTTGLIPFRYTGECSQFVLPV
jgi:hypothetical protein